MSNFYQRNLPHYQPDDGEFFVTFRLANSLPWSVISPLKQEYKLLSKKAEARESTIKQKIRKKYFGRFDHFLDHSQTGTHWLKKEKIAKIVAKKLRDFDNDKYTLICYCIMPNHVHLLLKLLKRDKSRTTKSKFPVTEILRLIKGSTAHDCNRMFKRKGAFWQHESYDHLVRDDKERERIIRYVLENPVKANLVEKWDDWRWAYCKGRIFSSAMM